MRLSARERIGALALGAVCITAITLAFMMRCNRTETASAPTEIIIERSAEADTRTDNDSDRESHKKSKGKAKKKKTRKKKGKRASSKKKKSDSSRSDSNQGPRYNPREPVERK